MSSAGRMEATDIGMPIHAEVKAMPGEDGGEVRDEARQLLRWNDAVLDERHQGLRRLSLPPRRPTAAARTDHKCAICLASSVVCDWR